MPDNYGYQRADIQTATPNADLGSLNVNDSPAQAGAGLAKVAQAGDEMMSMGERVQRQQDMNDSLKAKNESAVDLNQALLDFQSTMTGDPQQDQARWETVSAQIGQQYLGQLQTPGAQQAFAKEYDAMHKASALQVQNQSLQLQLENFKTESSEFLTNAEKGAFGLVKAGGPDYVNQVGQQFQGYADLINASPLLTQADKSSRIQAAQQLFYADVAKYQAETTPGAFSRDWRDGVWTKYLSADDVTKLQPYAEKAKVDNAYNTLYAQFTNAKGNLNAYGAFKAAMDPKQTPDLTDEQRKEVAGGFHTVWSASVAAANQAREDSDRAQLENIVNTMLGANGKAPNLPLAYKMLLHSSLPGETKLSVAQHIQTAGKGAADDPGTMNAGVRMVANGTFSSNWGLTQVASGKLTIEGFNKLNRLFNETDTTTKQALQRAEQSISDAFRTSLMANGTPAQALAKNAAMQDFLSRVDFYKKAGRNPIELVTPGNANYVLPQVINAHQLTMQQQIGAATTRANPGATAARPTPSAGVTRAVERALGITPSGSYGSALDFGSGGFGSPMRLPGETIEQFRSRTGEGRF